MENTHSLYQTTNPESHLRQLDYNVIYIIKLLVWTKIHTEFVLRVVLEGIVEIKGADSLGSFNICNKCQSNLPIRSQGHFSWSHGNFVLMVPVKEGSGASPHMNHFYLFILFIIYIILLTLFFCHDHSMLWVKCFFLIMSKILLEKVTHTLLLWYWFLKLQDEIKLLIYSLTLCCWSGL